MAEAVVPGVPPARTWAFLRDPRSASVLLPDVVEAEVVSGSGVGERQRYVSRSRGRDTVSLVEVTALVPSRSLEIEVLGRPFALGRRFDMAPAGDGTVLTVRSWAHAGWSWWGLGRLLQDDDEEYVARVAQVLPALVLPAPAFPRHPVHG